MKYISELCKPYPNIDYGTQGALEADILLRVLGNFLSA